MMRFRTLLLILLGGLILLTVSTVGVSSYLNARSAAHELSDQIFVKTSLIIDQEVEKLLGQAVGQCSQTLRLLQSHQLSLDKSSQLVGYWKAVLAVQPRITSFFVGLEGTGEAVGVSRLRKGKLSIWQTRRDPRTASLQLSEYWAADYPRKPFKSGVAGNDIRTRPWFMAAREKRRAIWTPTYVFLGVEGVRNVPGVTYAVPFYQPEGTLQAVLTADFDLETLSRFLARLHIGKKGSACLVERREDGDLRVIAHPHSEILVPRDPKGSGAGDLVPIEELEDDRIQAFLKQMPATVKSEGFLGTGSVHFSCNGERYLGSFHRITGASNPPWLICTYLPAEEVLANANQSNRLILVITFGVLALAILLSTYLARRVAGPLEQLATVAIEAGHLRLESRPPIRSVVQEVDRLANAAEEMKAGLRSFEKYVSGDLVRTLLASGQEASLGGEKRVVTVLFTDIAGFSAIAESMPSEVLVAHLGDYLGALSDVILQSGGTVDKFIGDAIMAFWGAPVVNPHHAAAACLAVHRCRLRLHELQSGWLAAGKPAFHTRFGLHTGEVIVGNIGSPARMNFTVIGDAVNLASRLEGLNKYYGTEILLSEQTYEEVKEVIVARPIDRVAVKGRAEAVPIYELLGLPSEVDAATRELAGLYATALSAYQERQWGKAVGALEEVRQRWPDDGPSRVLLERCRQYLATPPGEGWDGVNRMTKK
jgi:adenylate cyclase